ncbi:beta-carotene hydroxylase [Olea europaea subsp. europaea]|uniref:beta-carotene 3-hydroxylase n=1 Tax=Olea europaea subsp. europaea TaxID=158383 RepID=A0A8S0SFK3_OLEEU|nr:beta-carotene hydroxylase [Olea europaea subsp. europaea]
MAAGISVAGCSLRTILFKHNPILGPKPTKLFSPSIQNLDKILSCKWKNNLTVCFVLEDEKLESSGELERNPTAEEIERELSAARLAEKFAKKKSERFTYLVAAVMSSFGITSMAVIAVYYRFSWQMESHHRPREGPFELNDIFAIINAVPAIALLSYGFFHKGLVPGLCFGAGLGITVFGMAYMFVHDGLVHKRFPVGPIANVPYFRSVAAAHQLHHSDKFEGVPYGLFLGPKEIEEVGGLEELEKETSRRNKFSKNS